MGKTSSAVKDRWNAKTYDTVTFRVPKGQKANIQTAATAQGQSINAYINQAVNERMERERGEQVPADMEDMKQGEEKTHE